MENRWTIYCHTHIESGRRYIGLTKKSWKERWHDHVCSAQTRSGGWGRFTGAIRDYGPEAFSHEVLEICRSLDVANIAERSWIEFYETQDKLKGFNIMPGGEHRPLKPGRRPRLNQTHCKRGHAFTPENTILNNAPSRKGRGISRICRECKRYEERTAKRPRVRVLTPEQRAMKTAKQKQRRASARVVINV